MPYNTRRKSLSLPSLGIHVPNSSRSSSHRSPPSTAREHHQPPQKRVKRSHSSISSSPDPISLPRPNTIPLKDERPKSSGRVAENTPPPSPGGESGQTKIDTEGIDDVIVVGVIEQLEKTGNRPHLLKELAAVLSTSISIVESSANPAAIISSRLATYLKRPWTALSRCPLDKVLVGTHPKRVYYFLTTCPHQPIPTDPSSAPTTARIISPSLSSTGSAEGEEEIDSRSRSRMSPSPELDLSDPEFSDESLSFSNQSHPPTSVNIAHNRRAVSPPLERDEREFTQTASSLQQRRRSQDAEEKSRQASEAASVDATMEDSIPEEVEETEESAALRNSEAAAALFGHAEHLSAHAMQTGFASSSPMLKPHVEIEMSRTVFKSEDIKMTTEDEFGLGWSELKSPEAIELDELDDMFGGY